MQWCILPMSAIPSASSSATWISHSGRSRGSGLERMSSTIAVEVLPRRVQHVPRGVEAGIVDPHGLVEPERDVRQALAVARRPAQPVRDVRVQRLVVRARLVRGRVEPGDPADVHRRGRTLDGEEGRVEGGQALGFHGTCLPRTLVEHGRQ